MLSLDRVSLLVGTEAQQASLSIRAVNKASGRVRVVAPAPYQVRCGGSMSWGPECSVPTLAMNAHAAIEVSVAPGQTATEPAQLRVFSGTSVQYATLAPRSNSQLTSFQTPRLDGTRARCRWWPSA